MNFQKQHKEIYRNLLRIKNSESLIITPHVGWSSSEARKRLMKITLDHVKNFVSGTEEAFSRMNA